MIPRLCFILLAGRVLAGLDVNLGSPDSIRAAAKLKAHDVMSYYHGTEPGQTPGILPGPPPLGDYYWWQGGALWGTMIDYWHYTGDDAYNAVVEEAMLFQTGPPQNSYMPPNVTVSLGNDDQAFWGMSALLAAEVNFHNPPSKEPQWLELAQAVFNTQASPMRHDELCGGGLRWQIPPVNVGYDYKNAIANGCFFNLGARLARYTSNDTYALWAEKTWDWMTSVGMIDNDFNIYDGAHTGTNCTDINHAQFSYNVAIFLQGAAFMYNYTNGDSIWQSRVDGLVTNMIKVFFPGGVAKEISCEHDDKNSCTTDMLSFKGYIHRWLAVTAQMAPFTRDRIMDTLRSSAQAAVNQCTGGGSGRVCGFNWGNGSYDGTNGAGQEMNALGALLSMLVDYSSAPYTNLTGGTSMGNPNAGGDPSTARWFAPITAIDKAGAAFLTAMTLSLLILTFIWMASSISEGYGPGGF